MNKRKDLFKIIAATVLGVVAITLFTLGLIFADSAPKDVSAAETSDVVTSDPSRELGFYFDENVNPLLDNKMEFILHFDSSVYEGIEYSYSTSVRKVSSIEGSSVSYQINEKADGGEIITVKAEPTMYLYATHTVMYDIDGVSYEITKKSPTVCVADVYRKALEGVDEADYTDEQKTMSYVVNAVDSGFVTATRHLYYTTRLDTVNFEGVIFAFFNKENASVDIRIKPIKAPVNLMVYPILTVTIVDGAVNFELANLDSSYAFNIDDVKVLNLYDTNTVTYLEISLKDVVEKSISGGKEVSPYISELNGYTFLAKKSQFVDEMTDLQNQINELNEQISAFNDERNALQSQLNAKDEEIAALNAVITEKEAEIKAIEEEKARIEGELKESQTTNVDLTAQLKALELSSQTAVSERDKALKDLENVTAERDRLQSALDSSDNELAIRVNDLLIERANLQKRVSELEQENEELKEVRAPLNCSSGFGAGSVIAIVIPIALAGLITLALLIFKRAFGRK